ncbi:hypothetical protein SAMN02745117_02501 [Lampropedia hyalina DSM 16112]|jgi:hypothetical protein|uniref:Uncharacterized protein n=1 Tax=Lampropedia hyalina DSM 16112 TaxID=1122156 RepID=A0A1M5E037_9BURK|nr:hypothetical protein [Lampropedia hyalina]SHF72607.1 hypothetical protein SAMN02745117_02501 [Lampropedia hyalina DSM 16112]
MRHRAVWIALAGGALLAWVLLIFWAWRQGGLELLQLDMVIC